VKIAPGPLPLNPALILAADNRDRGYQNLTISHDICSKKGCFFSVVSLEWVK